MLPLWNAQQRLRGLRILMSRGLLAGIDLGTSNSVVAVVEEGLPRVLPDEAGCITLPSWVTFTDVRCMAPLMAAQQATARLFAVWGEVTEQQHACMLR